MVDTRAEVRWQVARAKEHLSEVIRAAAEEPQLILSRDRLVAAVVDPETFQAFEQWRTTQQQTSVADAFAELRELCAREGYALEVPDRRDRRNAFIDALDDFPR